ncbi:MAG: hypothetical protein ACOC85_03495 [Thermoplasmatota archaeon]
MNKINLDIDELITKAEESEYEEAYQTVERGSNFKIGAGARINPTKGTTLFMEVVISFSSEKGTVDVNNLREKASLLEKLKELNYILKWEKDNSVISEKNISKDDFQKEYKKTMELFDHFSSKDEIV